VVRSMLRAMKLCCTTPECDIQARAQLSAKARAETCTFPALCAHSHAIACISALLGKFIRRVDLKVMPNAALEV